MTTGDGFRALADLLDALGTTDVDVLDVSVASGEENTLVADLHLEVPVDGTVDPGTVAASAGGAGDAADVDTDGTDGRGASSPEGESAESRDRADVEPSVRVDSGGDAPQDRETADATEGPSVASPTGGADAVDGVACRAPDCGEVFETEHGMKIHHTKVHGPSLEDGQPAYQDPDRLREAYESHDSFAEMCDALGVDVSAQTVRRYAIRHGIHDPAGGDDTATGEAESDGADGSDLRDGNEPAPERGDPAEPIPDEDAGENRAAVVDGGRAADVDAGANEDGGDRIEDPDNRAVVDRPEVGASGADLPDVDLPDGIELADVKAAVESASTLYEVQRALELDRERATALLRELDLLELVHGRVATKRRREDLKEEIDQRIRERAASG